MIHRQGLEERLDRVISPVMNDRTPGMALLIAEGDDIVLRKAYGLADLETGRKIVPEDNFVIASNTKQFTCMAHKMAHCYIGFVWGKVREKPLNGLIQI